jgi:hypothetical protein
MVMAEERLKGNVHESGTGWMTREWPRILQAHAEELPDIAQYYPGSFNIVLTDRVVWRPPNEGVFYALARPGTLAGKIASARRGLG